MKALEIKGSVITLKNNIGGIIHKRLKGLKTKPYFTYGFSSDKYFVNIETLEIEKANESDGLNTYRFNVEYEHKGMERGWNQKDTSVKAKNYDEALKKVYKKFKNIYEISEI